MTISSVLKKYWENILIRHLLLAILILVFLVISVFLFLKIFTHHGEALSVPYLYGMTVEEVEETIRENLKFEVIDSIYLTEKNKGTVIEQNPEPGFKVKKDRTIFLTMNAYHPEKIRMPNIVGVSVRQAKAIIETNGLRIGELIYVPDIAINNVLEQRFKGKPIAEGDSIYKGSFIDIVIGQGLSHQKTRVPLLINMTVEEAKDRISDVFLNLASPIPDNSVLDLEDSLNSRIWKQRPHPDNVVMLPLGSYIDIWITTDSTKIRTDSTSINSELIEESEKDEEFGIL